MGASETRPGSPRGERILKAIEEEGRTINSTEEDLGMSRGHLGRIVRGERGTQTIDVELFANMAKLLHVNFEWLVLGEGPMRRGGRGPTSAEEAIRFARQAGAREDAIQSAWERNRDREDEMTSWDWVNVINGEAQRLAGTPRPEHVRDQQRKIAREKKKLETATGKATKSEPPIRHSKRAAGAG